MPAGMEVKCEVCGEKKARYSCPKCPIRYCSVKCCKSHKANCNAKPAPPPSPPKPEGKDLIPHLYRSLKDSTLLSLCSSPYIKLAIQNEELKTIISTIDKTENRERALETALKTNHDFSEFVDKLLDVVSRERS
ncbi:hypothetical protein AAMO2058_000496200 [Amorphochlora amoebiformis]